MEGSVRRQIFASQWKVPEGLRQELQHREPSVTDTGPAIRAFRQWLRVDTAQPGRLVIPSRAVRVLWDVFTSSGGEWGFPAYRRKVYGWRGVPTSGFGDTEGVALAYALAARDEGAHGPLTLQPLLFSVDETIGIVDGERWTLRCANDETCTVERGRRCIRHELVPLVPEELPWQLVARTPHMPGAWTDNIGGGGLGGGDGYQAQPWAFGHHGAPTGGHHNGGGGHHGGGGFGGGGGGGHHGGGGGGGGGGHHG